MQISVPVPPTVTAAPGAAETGSGEPASRDPFPWTELAMSLAKLAIVGAAIANFVRAIAVGSTAAYTTFATKNVLPLALRHRFVIAVLVGAALPVVVAGAFALWQKRRAVPAIVATGHLLGPLALLAFYPVLAAHHTWHGAPATFLVVLAIFGVAAERLFGAALGAVPPAAARTAQRTWDRLPLALRVRLPLVLACLAGLAYASWAGYYTLLNHRRLGTAGYDLGIYDNLMYNALHGQFFRSSTLFGPNGGNYIAGHAEFAMLLFLPFYAIHRGPETLLLLQAALLGLAAVPLYLFASTQIPRWSALLVACAYLLYAPLHGPNFYDFHWIPLAIFFHFWFYFAIATRRTWLIAVVLPILFLIREDVAVGTSVVGLFLLGTGARPRFGMLLAALSVAWFVTDKFVIMPRAGSWWFADLYKDLVAEGEHGYGSIIKTILINPVYFLSTLIKENKVVYVLQMFAPLAFLPGRRLPLLALACPGFFFTLMTTAYEPTLSIAFQYTTHWIPYLFAATVLSLAVLGRGEDGGRKRRGAVFAMSLCVLAHSYVFGGIFQHDDFVGGFAKIEFTISDAEKKNYADLRTVAAMIPQSASVAATERECPHVSSRMTAYTLKDHHGDADYLLIRLGHMGLGSTRTHVIDAFSRHTYGLAKKAGEFFLFKRDLTTPETDAAKTELGLPRTGASP